MPCQEISPKGSSSQLPLLEARPPRPLTPNTRMAVPGLRIAARECAQLATGTPSRQLPRRRDSSRVPAAHRQPESPGQSRAGEQALGFAGFLRPAAPFADRRGELTALSAPARPWRCYVMLPPML